VVGHGQASWVTDSKNRCANGQGAVARRRCRGVGTVAFQVRAGVRVEGDLVPGEAFELADQVASSAVRAEPGLVVAGSEVVVAGSR
jgi:hypothetical protein